MSKQRQSRQLISICIVVFSGICTAGANGTSDDMAQELAAWRSIIAETPVPFSACFHAEYPDVKWTQVACGVATNTPFRDSLLAMPTTTQLAQRSGNTVQTVGGGGATDWMAQGANMPNAWPKYAGGSFVVSGVTGESDAGGTNDYSVQLNSNFFASPACPVNTNCQGWEQFVYSTGLRQLLIQFWLINYGSGCPSGWTTYGNDCYRNSPTVAVPALAATGLGTLSMYAISQGRTNGGSLRETQVTLTIGSNAYSTYDNQGDVLDLTHGWTQAEFNVFGDGSGYTASFNPGSSITVGLQIYDYNYSSPAYTNTLVDSCVQNSVTGEKNNLLLGTCTSTPGNGGLKSYPYITFTEHN